MTRTILGVSCLIIIGWRIIIDVVCRWVQSSYVTCHDTELLLVDVYLDFVLPSSGIHVENQISKSSASNTSPWFIGKYTKLDSSPISPVHFTPSSSKYESELEDSSALKMVSTLPTVMRAEGCFILRFLIALRISP